MIDPRLIKAINKGRCFVLVGSGPSCEMGYPSWKDLSQKVVEDLLSKNLIKDKESYDKYLHEMKYPELFSLAEVDYGDKNKLVELLKKVLAPTAGKRGEIYEILSKLPFACYLTTNFDDEIIKHLKSTKEHFEVLSNRPQDFFKMRDGASNIVQKLHSDFNSPADVVITFNDYQNLYVSSSKSYFKDKLRQIFEMFDVLIIGHSLKDPDLQYILQLAKETASPKHPIFMISSDFCSADERLFIQQYNIALFRYQNNDGQHANLHKLLGRITKFISLRGVQSFEISSRSLEEVGTVTALFLFRRLQFEKLYDQIEPLILTALSTHPDHEFTDHELLQHDFLKNISKIQTSEWSIAISEALKRLVTKNYIEEHSNKFRILDVGIKHVQECYSVRDNERNQAYGQFLLDIENSYSSLSSSEKEKCKLLAEKAIITTFSNRGLAITNRIFSGHYARPAEMTDIFICISTIASEIESKELRGCFIDAMHQFIVRPSQLQKIYLASVSQGYFLFHLLGHDPRCKKLRKDIFERTFWFCDSSVLLPLMAAGCYNHDYSVELFQLLHKHQALLFTTSKLLQETWEHFEWAIKFMKDFGESSPEFIQVALAKGSQKQNLFIDGYIRLRADGTVSNYSDYLHKFFPNIGMDQKTFEELIIKKGCRLINISEITGFVKTDWAEIEDAKVVIRKWREGQGTFRAELQVEAEAEVWELIKNLRSKKYSLASPIDNLEKIYFLSHSRGLDRIFKVTDIITWGPEDVFRYLLALPDGKVNPDLLQQCMLDEYYFAGVSFIDEKRYIQYFGPNIDAAKVSFEKEKEEYISHVEKTSIKDLEDQFKNTPDLEKIFFVSQMGWKEAERAKAAEEYARKQAYEAEAKLKHLQIEKANAWKSRSKQHKEQEAARIRNARDPKYLRKKARQAKKRRRKR